MSIVIDGKDILEYNSIIAIVMSQRLDRLLKGEDIKIPVVVLQSAKNLFATGMTGMNYINGKAGPVQPEAVVTYMLLRDMLRRLTVATERDIDSRLEELVLVMQELEPDGKQVQDAREQYQTLQSLFMVIHGESCRYSTAHGRHSPYSIGTFDDDEDD